MRCLLLFALATACSHSPGPATTPAPSADPLAELHALNAEARAGAVTERIHGVEVHDPYRLLEEDSALTRRWIEAQNRRTRGAIQVDPAARARIATLLRIGSLGDVDAAGDRVFYRRREGDREQPVYVVREGQQEHVLIDPTTFGERAALDWAYPSPDGRLVAFGISTNGDERSTLRLLEVDARIADPAAGLRPLEIPRTKWCNLAWLHDGSGFYYTRYPAPGEEGFDAESEDTYFPRIYFHALGTDPQDDVRVFGSATGTDFPIPSVSRDDRWLVVNVFRGWSASDVFVHEREGGPGPDDEHPLRPIITGEEALTFATVHEGKLYARTNLGAPNYRIVTAAIDRAHDRSSWTDLVAETDAPIEDWALVGDGAAVHYLRDVASELVLVSADGARRPVELPTRGAIDGLAGEPGDPRLRFAFSGYLQPPSLLEVDASARARVLTAVEADFDFDAYVVRQARVRSADGTSVPVTFMHRADLRPNGEAPVLLYGYGGFNVSLLPSLRRSALYWLERGGVYAVATLRGGGEFGEAWHRAGMLGNKERVFEDFEAAIGWLGGESGISRPSRIAITGGSNGGLLMGAMITRVPERFAAAASYVGLYDMVRYHRFPPAELWVSEYGSAEDPEQFRWLHAYSPYHRVRAGTAYPAVLIETADHDSRVHWAHSTKFAAALQEANASDRPIYFFRAESQGHGAGTRLSDQVDRLARMYAFVEQALR